MKKFLMIGIILLLVSVATASTVLFLYPYPPKEPPRADDTGWTKEGVQEVVNGNNKFALELYSELSKSEKGNIFFSPYSISSALAIVYEGARGRTAEEIKSVFHFPSYETLRPNFAAIYNSINKGYKDYELRTGNALWVQQSFPLLEEYTSTVERYYGGKATNLDFVGETEKSRETINSFIEEQTNGKIKDLIPQGFLSPQTVLVITNAIYFKGTWVWEFDPKETREMDFKISSNNTIKVPMMFMKPSEKARFNYTETDDLQILELPYKGGKISMLILLPKGDLSSIEPLTLEKIEEWKSKMKETELDSIYLPKFEFKAKYFLNDNLKRLGMPTAFTPSADFSGITAGNIWISSVIHEGYVKVDEKGTEAAAATAVIIARAIRGNVFRADHPFIFIIQERDTGNILFLGRVVNPTQQ
jgi:serpin B